ncbi:VacJ family lipoprotein [Endozoicomonas sp. ONNA2]|uniref:MlaA family lipoprotein n=1 Tax=Endozoicomonas sp. ONNA2 TaxID=2828741 RepID=UPI002147FA6A|nr:VacJ family lipoprotein [Endozoicomonas sp. ONNA2]
MNHSPAIIVRSVAVMVLILLPTMTFGTEPISYDDPLESWNRRVSKLNDTLDNYALKPMAKAYNFVTPGPVQTLVSNFFSNLGELRNIASAGFQLKGQDALVSSGRFIINSTAGILGLIDVATPIGLDKRYSDFGLAFANWGVPSGPYIVLPLLGPNTVRSGVGLIPDALTNPLNYHDSGQDRWIAGSIHLINSRAQLLDIENLIIGDHYTFFRDTYLQRREYLITGQQPEDDF